MTIIDLTYNYGEGTCFRFVPPQKPKFRLRSTFNGFFFGHKFSEPNGLIYILSIIYFGQGCLSKVPPLDSTGDV